MTETTTSSSTSAVESARLEAVTHLSLSPEEPTELDKASVKRSRRWCARPAMRVSP